MRAVVQRVTRASVTVEGELVGAIERGLCVLVGVAATDTEADAARLCQKIARQNQRVRQFAVFNVALGGLDEIFGVVVAVALVCAGCAVLYGIVTSRWLLALSPGNEEMRSISAAVQEGAKAYLNRQYTIIAGVAVVIAILIAVALDVRTAIGFIIGGTFSGAAGFIGMNVSVRSNARVAEAARGGVAPALKVAFRGIDRSVARHAAKHGRRRPLRIDFCEADVLDVFDEWLRATGLTLVTPASTATLETEGSAKGAGSGAAREPARRNRAS